MSTSNMDDQFRHMDIFYRELVEFNQNLVTSWSDTKKHHESVNPYWKDEMRKEYDATWEPLEETMKHYLEVETGKYTRFLESKLQALRRYLYGG